MQEYAEQREMVEVKGSCPSLARRRGARVSVHLIRIPHASAGYFAR